MLRRLAAAKQGSIMPIVIFACFTIIAVAGFVIDGGRLALMHSSLLQAIDSAGLSAVAKMSTSDIDTQVRKFTEANFSKGYVGASITRLSAVLSSDEKTLTVSASAEAPTTFMQLLGIDVITTSAQSEVTRAVGGLELVLVLDNTGSMAGNSLTSLKSAANSLLDIVFGDKATAENLYVGIVPFSQSVNIGASHTAWMDTASIAARDWGTTAWGGCVEARANSLDVTDTPPTTTLFEPYYWEDGSANDWITTTTTTSRKNGKTTTTTSKSYKSPLDQTQGPNKYCSAEVTPMTSTKKTLVTALSAMQAVGNTHVNFGAVWGWRMLSPRWRGLWGGDMTTHDLPLDYNTASMSKAAVIMTDGENTMSSTVYTAYGWLSDGTLGTTSSSRAVTQLDTRLTEVCTAMKNAGVTVYTIAFGGPGTSIENLLKNCATQSDYYFDSPTTAALTAAFQQIGDSLSKLRVSR